jgi:hypothetical protein
MSFRSFILFGVALGSILAGCGGAATDQSPRVLGGNGFTFAAPAGWDVARRPGELSASGGKTDLVSVQVFRLTRPYRPALFGKAAVELDRVAGQLADGLDGHVTESRTVTVAGRRARQYVLAYRDLVQEVTFVLVDRREYQLLCRRMAKGDGGACVQLVSSFRLSS